jgi:hypothetical protein
MYLSLNFLVLRAMIQYHNMILLSPLSSLISVPHYIFANMTCMILPPSQGLRRKSFFDFSSKLKAQVEFHPFLAKLPRSFVSNGRKNGNS